MIFADNTCSIRTERKTLPKNAKLARIRSVFSPTKKTLYLNKNLSTAQQNFLIGRELGFQYLQLSERAYETIIQKAETFDKLLNNFKASYFASALLMSEQEMVHDVYAVAQLSQWDNQLIFRLLKKYDVTPEMLLQRLTNILPRHFDVKDLFFLRIIGSEDLKTFTMDKELHLSQLHSPYANHLQEHYCRRWASLRVLKKLRAHTAPKDTILAEAQISQYWQTDKSYFILSVGKMLSPPNKKSVSVTLGLMITDKLQSLFRFLNPTQRPPAHLPMHTVHTTCERCAISDCNERAVPPVYIERQQELAIIEEEVQKLR
jgi:Zn-dependent peptidase ImmA (M78 family)